MKVLYVNHAEPACGVYQIGKRIADLLKPSTVLDVAYVESATVEPVVAALNQHRPRVVLYNYYPATLPFVSGPFTAAVRQAGIAQFGIIHDPMEPAFIAGIEQLFDFWIVHDPTNPVASSKKFTTVRPVPRFDPAPPPARLSFGTHGFGISPWKAFDFIVAVVNHEFDEADINMNIGLAAFGDRDGAVASQWRAACQRQVTKPGIRLNITHDFLATEADLIRYLQGNTVNVYFVRDPPAYTGPAGSADLAIASGRALVVNNGYMYRHVSTRLGAYGVNGQTLRSLCQNERAVADLYREWSPQRVRADYEQMIAQTVRPA